MKLQANKHHLPYVAAFLLLTLVFLGRWWLMSNSHTLGDIITYYYPRAVAQQESIRGFNDFLPLWNPYIFSGDVFLAKPAALNPILGVLLAFLPPMVSIHINIIVAMFLAAAFMYLLSHYITRSRMAAFISSIIYMFSGFVLTTVIFYGWVVFANAYMLMPLLLLFLLKAAGEKLLLNSVLAGIVLGFFIIAGSGIEFLYATVILGVFLLVNLIGSNFRNRLVRSAVIGLVVIVVCFGLSAFKLLPVLEYQKLSVRASLGWEEASGRTLPVSGLFTSLVEPVKGLMQPSNKIGIFAFILALFAIYKRPKNRNTIFFTAVVVVSLLLASGSFLLYWFWKFYPGWGGMRYADRAIIMLVPAAAVLAGIGVNSFFAAVKRRFSFSDKKMVAVFAVLAALIIVDLAVLGSGGQSNARDERYKYRDIDEVIAANGILQNLSVERQHSIFRIHTLETTGIDWGIEFYTVPLKLENIYGYDTQWLPSYLNGYLSVANNAPAKMWGVLNVKYLTSRQPVNISGFRLVSKFSACAICFPEEPVIQKAWGPYLYENERFMPRAWLAGSAILVVGNDEPARNIIYSLMLDSNFDPAKVVIVKGREKVDMYSLDELKHYRAIVLSGGSVSEGNQELIRQYSGSGGILLPDIVHGKTAADQSDVDRMFEAVNGSYRAISDADIDVKSFSKKSVNTGKSPGRFLVLSERYAFFPGWKARGENGNAYGLLQAYNAITAVYIDSPEGIVSFEYMPMSFVVGSVITALSLLALFGYFACLVIVRTRRKPASA